MLQTLEGKAARLTRLFGSPSRPDRETIDQWWDAYRNGTESRSRDEARNNLIHHYLRTQVNAIAARLHAAVPKHVDREDLEQQGYFGLIDAMQRFDPSREVRFEAYAGRRIRGAIRDYLRQLDVLPRQARSRFRQLMALQERYRKRYGRPPTEEELRDGLGLNDRKWRNLMLAARPVSHTTLAGNRRGSDDDESDIMLGFAQHGRTSPLTEAEREDLKRWVTRGFSRRDRLIIILYYYERMTMKAIGQTVGCSESRISQRLEAIVKCLRSRLYAREHEQEFVFAS